MSNHVGAPAQNPATAVVLVLGLVALGAELAAKAGEAVAEQAREMRYRLRERLDARRGGAE